MSRCVVLDAEAMSFLAGRASPRLPMHPTAIDGATVFAAQQSALYLFDGEAVAPLAVEAPERVRGLALDPAGEEPARLLVATLDVLYAYVLP